MNLCINDFEGPLDLLLHLVKSAKMDIYEIDTKQVINDYLEFINSLDKEDLDDASEYLVMAAELIHLKSRLLINLDVEEDSNDEYSINSEEDLKQKLIEYEKYKNITDAFRGLEENRKSFFTKSPESFKELDCENAKMVNDGTVSVQDLVDAIMNLRKREQYQKPISTRITKKELSVKKKTNYIRDILLKRKKVEFADLFDDYSKENIVVTFLSILNMSKSQEVVLSQKENFAKIYVERADKDE